MSDIRSNPWFEPSFAAQRLDGAARLLPAFCTRLHIFLPQQRQFISSLSSFLLFLACLSSHVSCSLLATVLLLSRRDATDGIYPAVHRFLRNLSIHISSFKLEQLESRARSLAAMSTMTDTSTSTSADVVAPSSKLTFKTEAAPNYSKLEGEGKKVPRPKVGRTFSRYNHLFAIHAKSRPSPLTRSDQTETPNYNGFRNLMALVLSACCCGCEVLAHAYRVQLYRICD